MNREQRRAALRQASKIKGFDITKGTLEVSIANSDEKLVVDVMDAGVMFAFHDMYHKFSHLEETYKDEYEKAFANNDDSLDAKFMLMRKIITDFSEAVDNIFGEDSCKKLFGHKYPQLVQIKEFIEDFGPVARAIIASSGIDSLADESAAMPATPTMEQTAAAPTLTPLA